MDPIPAQTRSISPSPNPLYGLESVLQDEAIRVENEPTVQQVPVSVADHQELRRRSNTEASDKEDADINEADQISEITDLNYPRVNCPEKIVICLDMSSEMNKLSFRSRSGDKFAPLKLIKRALGLFLQTKSRLNHYHQFALVIMQEEACWVCDFTYSAREIIHHLEEYSSTSECTSFDLSSLYNTLKENVELPVVLGDQSVIPPSHVVRVIFIYGRSQCQLNFSDKEAQKFLESSPYFFLDAFYIHEPVADDNKCEETFNTLCDLDCKGLSYIVEISRNPTKLHDYMAQLLAHPLQRPLQSDTAYKIQPPDEIR
ncbi:BRISC and BRCA1-A complex member 1-like [Haliotis asinina]|uniref:BRISC and BRCA1-A complex member 1-like n=1 Tax=Haliotis asinina TaxID=109174 RepID=UPI003531B2A9